jgi:hypothetical protein
MAGPEFFAKKNNQERHKGGWMTAAGSTKETQDLPAEASEGNSLFRCGGGGGEGK